MKRYMLPTDTHIGGWFMPMKTINKVIKFWDNPDFQEYKVKGKAKIYSSEETSVNDIKDSTDIYINAYSVVKPWGEYLDCLQDCLENYIKVFPFAAEVDKFEIEEYFNYQHYEKGGGFKLTHIENRGCPESGKRHLVFMTYLDTLENAGTEFPDQNLITPSIKGLTLIWPSYFTHPHVSQVSHDSEKKIITGWYGF